MSSFAGACLAQRLLDACIEHVDAQKDDGWSQPIHTSRHTLRRTAQTLRLAKTKARDPAIYRELDSAWAQNRTSQRSSTTTQEH